MNMKTIRNKIYAALAFVALLSPTACVEEAPVYEAGEPDLEGCYGVYFPTQTSEFALEPTDPTSVTITLARTVSNGNITVPVVLSDETGVFSISDVVFEDGQSETTATLNFPTAEVGTNYSFYINIEDPEYASQYSANSTSLSVSVIREKWNDLGKAKWRDDFVTAIYGVSSVEYEVEVQENANQKGLYRFKNVYGEAYPYNTAGNWDTSKDYWTVINSTDSTKVYISTQRTGCDWGYGAFYVSSMAGYYLAKGGEENEKKAEEYYGSRTNGCIKFPTGSLLFCMPNYQNGAFFYANNSGMFRVILPGGKDVDYTYSVTAELCENGKVPVTFTLGEDITCMKYLVVEGALDAREIQNAQDQVLNSDKALTVEESCTVDISCEKTGMYTVVAIAYADKVNKGCTGVAFGYVTPGEEEANATVVNAGLELTSRYEAAGYDKRNSAQCYIYGKNLADVKMGLYKTAEVEKYGIEEVVAAVLEGDSLSAKELEEVNGEGYAELLTSLAPLTSYTLVVWASNGYTDTYVTAEVTTAGLDRIKMTTGTYTYGLWWEGDDSGLEFYQDPNYENTYVIPNWGGGVDFTFTYDPATKKVVVATQGIGDTYENYGAVYIGEAKNVYSPKSAKYASLTDSYYDEATSTFHFSLAYFCSAGTFSNAVETFKLDEAIEFSAAKASSVAFKGLNIKPLDKQLDKIQVSSRSDFAPCGYSAGLSLEFTPRLAEFSATASERSFDKHGFKSNLVEFAE